MTSAIIGGFLGIMLAFIVIVIIIALTILHFYNKYKHVGIQAKAFYEEAKKAEENGMHRHKSVTGMTSIYLPKIQEDFKNFNEHAIYVQVENGIRAVLNSIEEKNLDYLQSDDFNLIREKVKNQISDLETNNISYRYDDIVFHNHSIKNYTKGNGIATLEISTSLEYYYSKGIQNNALNKKDVKKQTRYTTKLVYVIDSTKAGFDIDVLGLHCPNCGSAITFLDQEKCSYCKGALNIRVANLLKCWKLLDYKEDY